MRKATINLTPKLAYFLSLQTPPPLPSLLKFHSLIVTTGNTHNPFLSSKLISFYASLYKPTWATRVFNSVLSKDKFLWNSIIKAHFFNADYLQSICLYLSMKLSDSLPNKFTVPMVVTACAELGWLDYGKILHGLVVKLGVFEGDCGVGCAFISMYSRCGYMEDGCKVFDEIIERDVVAWTAVVVGYVKNGENEKGLCCLTEMFGRGGERERPNFRTLEAGFQACGNLGIGAVLEGRCLHGFVVKSGVGCDPAVKSLVLAMYSKCGTLEETCLSFGEVPVKDVMSWTLIIGIFAKLGCTRESLGGFLEMEASGVLPDGTVISCVLSDLANSPWISEGKTFHGLILKRNYVINQMVRNALMSMYCKFELLSLAEKLFNGVLERDKESWNIMVSGFGKVGQGMECLVLFREMQYHRVESDSNTLVSVISSCSQLGVILLGRSIHCYIIKSLMHENVSVSNSLVDMYGKLGNLAVARKIFCWTVRDTVTWNSLISAYNHNGQFAEAFSLFHDMVGDGIKPSSATLVMLLSACSHMVSLEKGELVYSYIKEGKLEVNIPLATALIDMYAKCGQLEKAREIFDTMKEKDAIACNVMISGYGMHGDAKSAVYIFQQMEQSNIQPNELTFLAVLSACTHAGLVEEGKALFGRMGEYSLRPTLKHYGCMVDLLGRAGNLLEAESLVLSMPIEPDGALWGALLNSCKIHNDTKMGIRIAKQAIESDPENDGYYIIISNLYNSIGMTEEAERIRIFMKERGVIKRAGWSAL